MEICELSSSEEVPETDHVIVVKLGPHRFEVSGTAGCETSESTYLRPLMFKQQVDALKQAEEFAAAHALPAIYVKGFQPAAD
jgi:hypothetical protein